MKQVERTKTCQSLKDVCLTHTEQAFIISYLVIREHKGRLRNLIIKQICIFSHVNHKETVTRILKNT